ncbi:MAG TPA: SusC/RagA family TonB-linked outer membrane protein [Draconibacterium sp.]|nr:SusC/RagA family TonB-linked outer membrane protein [Draconibacterium sp.]
MKRILLLIVYFFCIGVLIIQAQNQNVTGHVKQATDGTSISGVSIILKGTTIGTVTDENGNYKIDVPVNNSQLEFSFVGMKTVILPVNGSVVNAVLEPDFVGVDEVVVLGYISKGKNEITGSTVQVDGEIIDNIPVASVDQALQGKVPGLTISTTSGTPGSVQDILIRGVNSLTAGNSPLIVIDGVPVINDNFSSLPMLTSLSALSSVNRNDIQSITVLKDASATSAYGASGSNGVIVITTKKGRPGETKFNANAAIGFQNNATPGLKPLTGDHRAELLQEAAYNSFGQLYGFSKDQAADFLKNLTPALANWDGVDGNWGEALQNKNAPLQSYSVSAKGGDGISSFYASLGYDNMETTIIGGDFKRITSKLNYSRKFSEKVNFSANASVSNTRQTVFIEQGAYLGNPQFTKYFMSPWEKPFLADGVTPNTNLGTSVINTIYTIQNDLSENDLTRGMVNSFMTWDILDNLRFKTLYAADFNVAAFHYYQNRVHGDSKEIGGSAQQSVNRNMNWVSQNSLDYIWNKNSNNLAVKLLMEYQQNNNNYLYGYGEKFAADGLYYISSASANYDASSNFTDWKNLSYLGMINYNFAEKYIADFTFRREGSSKFAPGLRFGNFWSVGAAWNMKQETLLANVKSIDMLRLRGSYGLSGNSAIGINQYQSLLHYDANYNNQGAVYPGQFGNSNLTWEKNRNLDVGVDYSIFNGIINGSLAYFHKKTFDLLQDVPLSRTSGHNSILMNVGAMRNKGVEFILNTDIVRSSAFNINVSANVATVKNEVNELAKDSEGNDINIETDFQKVAVGHPVYGWYMRKWAGVNSDNGEAQWYINGKDGAVTNNYYEAQKNWQGESGMPTFTGGFMTHVDYKGIFLDVNLYYAGGHKIFEDLSFYTHHSGIYSLLLFNGVEPMMDRWQEPGDITDVPKVVYNINDDSQTSTRFLYDGDYVRIKDLVLGYSIPKSWINSVGFDQVTVSVRGTNLFTWVKDKKLKYDPEVKASGMTQITTPPVKSMVFGINVNF